MATGDDFTAYEIINTYKTLLYASDAAVSTIPNEGITGTLKTIRSADGSFTPLQLSSSFVNINGASTLKLNGTTLTATATELNTLVSSSGTLKNIRVTATSGLIGTQNGAVVSVMNTSATLIVNPSLSVTNFIANTGSFTTKVSGVAAEFSGNVSVNNLFAATNIFIAGTTIASNADVAAVSARVDAVSVLTSINAAAITSINSAITSINAGTFHSLDVSTSVQIGDFINLNGKVLTITGDTDDTFKITAGANGATTLETVDTAGTNANLTLDVDGNIHLDSTAVILLDAENNGAIQLRNSGTEYGTLFASGDNVNIKSQISNKDIVFRGLDDGADITALTLDMSEAGAATFNAGATFADDVTLTTGKVGIELTNSTAPIASLNIANDSADGTVDYTQGIVFSDSNAGGTPWTHAAIVATGSTGYNGNLIFATDGNGVNNPDTSALTERMRIAADGNVGIGTTAPDVMLDIQPPSTATNTGIKVRRPSSSTQYIHIHESDGSKHQIEAIGNKEFRISNESATFPITFYTNSTERMTLSSAGNLGIGTTSPLKKLHVDGPALSTVQTLTDAATVTSDFDVGQNFTLTLAGNRTLGAPSNVDAGQVGSIFIIQDGTGSRTLAYNTIWKFAGGTAPTLSTDAAAIDRLDYIVQTSTAIEALLTKAYA